MKKIYKKLFVLGIALLLSLTPGYSKAIELSNANQISPMFTNIMQFRSSFDISKDGKSKSIAYISATNVNKVSVELHLQQYNDGRWTTIKDWSGSKSGDNYELSKEWYVTSGYSYRLVSKGYVYQGTKLVESTSSISNTVFY